MATVELTVGEWAGPANEAHELTEFFPSGNVRTLCGKRFPVVAARTHVRTNPGQLLPKCRNCITLHMKESDTNPTTDNGNDNTEVQTVKNVTDTPTPTPVQTPVNTTPDAPKKGKKGKKNKGEKKGKKNATMAPPAPITDPTNIPAPVVMEPAPEPVTESAPKGDDVIGTWAAKDAEGTAHFFTERIGNVFKGACGRSVLNAGEWHKGAKHCQRCTSGKAAEVVANWGKIVAPVPMDTPTPVKVESNDTTTTTTTPKTDTTPFTRTEREGSSLDLLISEWSAVLDEESRKLNHYNERLDAHKSGKERLNKSAHRNMRNGVKNTVHRIDVIKRTIGALKDFDAL